MMDEQKAAELLQQLRSGHVKQYEVTKEEFLEFRKVLVKQEDFKHFRGTAHHKGNVTYEYTESPRS